MDRFLDERGGESGAVARPGGRCFSDKPALFPIPDERLAALIGQDKSQVNVACEMAFQAAFYEGQSSKL
jgi:hypothetical protein